MATFEPVSSAAIDDFWARTLERSRREPLHAVCEAVPQDYPYAHYRLTYRGLGEIPVRAYLTMPVEPRGSTRRWPLVLTVPGYSGRGMSAVRGDCLRGCALLEIYPRGMGDSRELWQVPPGSESAWITVGPENPEGFYYQGAYTDMVRALDYALTRPDIDPARIAVFGGSGGGLLALGMASIDARVNCVVANLPYLCDFAHNPAMASNREFTDPVFLHTWQYFEPVNLVSRLNAPTLLTSGGLDTTCPPVSIRAVYDQLPGIKALYHLPHLAHITTQEDYSYCWEWLNRYCLKADYITRRT